MNTNNCFHHARTRRESTTCIELYIIFFIRRHEAFTTRTKNCRYIQLQTIKIKKVFLYSSFSFHLNERISRYEWSMNSIWGVGEEMPLAEIQIKMNVYLYAIQKCLFLYSAYQCWYWDSILCTNGMFYTATTMRYNLWWWRRALFALTMNWIYWLLSLSWWKWCGIDWVFSLGIDDEICQCLEFKLTYCSYFWV